MGIIAIIPARFGSTRLPGKPLSEIDGKPMIRHVYERVRRARLVERTLVATEDERIAAVVRGFGGEAILTSASHKTGTDRLFEAAPPDARIVVNVQGDEPLIDPAGIDAVIEGLQGDRQAGMVTLATPMTAPEEMLSESVVKVVCNARGEALYFSRAPIPFVRGGGAGAAAARGLALRHIGLYAYTREALARFAALPVSPLEAAEGLEQLRALEDGIRIRVVVVDSSPGVAVDTPEDLERVRALFKETGPGGSLATA